MRKRRGRPKLANCSHREVVKALNRLGAFKIAEGSNHIKVTHRKTGKFSTIPRHSPINKHLLKDFVEDYLVKELGYLQEEIYKYLWC